MMDDYEYDAETRAVERAIDVIRPAIEFRDDATIMAFVRLAVERAYQDGRNFQARLMREEAERSVRI